MQKTRKVTARRPALGKTERHLAFACAAAVLLSALSAGCWGKREIEERAFIHLMGIDKGVSDRVHVTVTIAVPRMLGTGGDGGGMGGSGESPGLTLSSEGHDITDALSRIESMSSREITGMHISCVILGEEFAEDNVAPVMDVFTRSMEVRPNTLIAVCRGNAGEFIKKAKTPEERELADYITKLITTTHEHLGYCPVVTMQDFSVAFGTVESSPWAPLLDLAATKPAEKTAGDTPVPHAAAEGLNPFVVSGAALFGLEGDRYRMVGNLSPEETRAALLLAGKSKGWTVDFQSPGESEVISLMVRHSSLRTKVDRDGDNVSVNFGIRLAASIEEFVVNPKAPPTTNQIRTAAARKVQQEIELLCKQVFEKMKSLGTDPIALGRSVHGTFLTQPDWEAFNWTSKLGAVTANFDVNVEIFSTGFTFQRAYPR